MWGVGIRRGKNLNFTHQKVNKQNFGDFPLHCFPTCALGGKTEDAIKGQEDEGRGLGGAWGNEKEKETNKKKKKDGGREGKEVRDPAVHMTCSHSAAVSDGVF